MWFFDKKYKPSAKSDNPADGRVRFVFSAGEPIIALMSRASQLLRLQQTDIELDTCRARLMAIEATLGDAPAVRAAQHTREAAEAQFTAARLALKNIELDVQTLNEKIADADKRLYGGRITNPKELNDLQKDIESLKRQRGGLEEQQLEALIAAEAAETQLHAGQTAVHKAEAEAAKTQGDLLEERATLTARVETLEAEREAMQAPIPADDRELYEKLRPVKRGRAVSRLDDGNCSACGVAPSSSRSQDARQGNALILCGNCGRILCAD